MKVFNFSAGPACLPEAVLKKAQEELVHFGNSGMSVMEMSHRSADFEDILARAQKDLRALMNIPENYKILFLQGGASLQFSMIPLNLMTTHKRAYYVNTGMWSKKAISEAKKTGEVVVPASSEDKTFSYIPELNADMFKGDADYVHITSNNTIYGTRYTKLPDVNGLPLISDMSSCILSEVIDVNDYAVIYAGAQKNIGPAGVTLVIIREDLIGKAPSSIPTMLDYKIQHAADVRHLHCGPGILPPAGERWNTGDAEDERVQSRVAVRLPRQLADVQGHRGEEGPLFDEHTVCDGQRRPG